MDLDPADRLLLTKDDPLDHSKQTKPAPPQPPQMSLSSTLTRAKGAFGKSGAYVYTSVRRVDGNETSDNFPKDSGDDVKPRELWAPFFLRRPAMLSFFTIFFAILWSLVALYIYSARNGGREGLITDDDKYYYVWTYGPAAGV